MADSTAAAGAAAEGASLAATAGFPKMKPAAPLPKAGASAFFSAVGAGAAPNTKGAAAAVELVLAAGAPKVNAGVLSVFLVSLEVGAVAAPKVKVAGAGASAFFVSAAAGAAPKVNAGTVEVSAFLVSVVAGAAPKVKVGLASEVVLAAGAAPKVKGAGAAAGAEEPNVKVLLGALSFLSAVAAEELPPSRGVSQAAHLVAPFLFFDRHVGHFTPSLILAADQMLLAVGSILAPVEAAAALEPKPKAGAAVVVAGLLLEVSAAEPRVASHEAHLVAPFLFFDRQT